MGPWVEIAVALPVEGAFTYAVPETLSLAVGDRVLVPFGRRRVTGYVLGPAGGPPPGTPRAVQARLDPEPILTPPLLGLCRWTADYYLHPLGEVIRTALPPGINVHTERWVRITEAGRQAMAAPRTPVAEREALERLATSPEGEARAGGRNPPVEPRVAERLLARGWAEAVQALRGARIRALEVERVSLVDPAAADQALTGLGRAPAQAAVLQWLSVRGEVTMEELRAAFPRAREAVNRLAERGLVQLRRDTAARTPEAGPEVEGPGERPAPTVHQAQALEALVGGLGRFQPTLLEGVTGSGKTEVYMRLIEAARARDLGALVLVPEIALTPQLVGRFRERFGGEVAVLHSGLSEGERHDEWWRLRRGEARVAVGVRSAVFAPVERLGVVVVDEEHDGSFKQDEGLRYHARDLAVVRARTEDAVAVLGSATPSAETVQNARSGRYRHLVLPERVHARPLPQVTLVDLREDRPARAPTGDPRGWVLSDPLLKALEETRSVGRQSILLLNRRGHAPSLVCPDCGEAARCPNCEVTLTLHRGPTRALCHYCGFEIPPPGTCADCGGEVGPVGVGTQAVAEELGTRLPGIRVARLDRDSTARKGALARILADFGRGRADVLVGTQMVAKGHDFPGVTLVGVVLADLGLLVPDFRASERTFQLLHQVAGRAGRGADPGRVFIQTWRPEHPAVALAAAGDFQGFMERELAERQARAFPPAGRLLLVRIEGVSETRVQTAAERLGERAEALAFGWPDAELEVLGPGVSPLARLRGRHRWQLLVKAPTARTLRQVGRHLAEVELPPGVSAGLDLDPISLL